MTSPPPETPPPASESPTDPARRTFWQRHFRDPIVAQLTQGITPQKIALTLAVGTACALFPVIGFTTLLCTVAGVALKLNQPIIQLLNQASWPIHIPVMFACIRTGEYLFSAPPIAFDLHRMRHLIWDHPRVFLHEFGATALHAAVAWCLFAPPFIALVYFTALPITRRIARLKARTDEASP